MKRRTDEEISAPLYAYDADIRAQYGCFAGVDEAGRGPLCGPVCVAACILDPEAPVYGINDSKKLSEKKREALFDQIVEKALAYKIVFIGPDIIDRDNILNATMGGMRQAVEGLDIVPNLVLVDGNRIPDGLTMPAQPVVKATPPAPASAQRPFWLKSAVTAICWSWTSSIPSISWQSTRLRHQAPLRAHCPVRHSAVLPPQLPQKAGLLARGQVMDRAGTGRRGEAAAARSTRNRARPSSPTTITPGWGR